MFRKSDSFCIINFEVSNPENIKILSNDLQFCNVDSIIPDSGWKFKPSCLPYIKPDVLDLR
jgi:hypothetical protein